MSLRVAESERDGASCAKSSSSAGRTSWRVAAQLGLTPESHLLITRYLETPEGRAAHQELKKIFEETRSSRPMGGRREPRE